MCLAVPAKIMEIDGDIATVEIDGIRRSGNVCFITSPQIGDYVLIHAGFAIKKWSEEDVNEFNEIMNEMNEKGEL